MPPDGNAEVRLDPKCNRMPENCDGRACRTSRTDPYPTSVAGTATDIAAASGTGTGTGSWTCTGWNAHYRYHYRYDHYDHYDHCYYCNCCCNLIQKGAAEGPESEPKLLKFPKQKLRLSGAS